MCLIHLVYTEASGISLSMNLARGKTTRDKAENTVVHVVSTGHFISSEAEYKSGAQNILVVHINDIPKFKLVAYSHCTWEDHYVIRVCINHCTCYFIKSNPYLICMYACINVCIPNLSSANFPWNFNSAALLQHIDVCVAISSSN